MANSLQAPRSGMPIKRALTLYQKARLPLATILGIAAATSPMRSGVVLVCRFGSGAAEGIGIASLSPLIVIAGDSTGESPKSAAAGYVLDAMHAVGFPASPLFLVFVLALGLIGKALLSLL